MHALLVAGSRGKSGAAALAGKAALRMGAGLVTVATPAGALPLVATPVLEIMTAPLVETESGAISDRTLDYGRFAKLAEGKTVLALGPGLGTHPETIKFVRAVLEQFDLPLVLDADALNALVGQLEVLRGRRSKILVLTPHPGEFARLLGTTGAEVQRQRVDGGAKIRPRVCGLCYPQGLSDAGGDAGRAGVRESHRRGRLGQRRGRATCSPGWWRGRWRSLLLPRRRTSSPWPYFCMAGRAICATAEIRRASSAGLGRNRIGAPGLARAAGKD